MSMAGRFKSYFLRGLATLLPTIVTIWIFVWAYKFIQENISIHINRGLVRLIMIIEGEGGIPKERLTEILVNGAGSIVGFLIALFAVCIVGAFLASMIGKTLWRVIEKFIMNTPVLRKVYPYVKQVTDYLITQDERTRMFSRVVAIEYPRKGVWSVGFVTGSGPDKVAGSVDKEFLTVLVPTSPTPFTGYVIIVPKEQSIELNITVEEAFRFIISGGVVAPDGARHIPLPKTETDKK